MRRLPSGGAIDRSRPLAFRWNDRSLQGYAGDSLASALLGAGIDILGASVALGRPRGVMSAGMEEATGFAQLSSGGATEPLVRTTGLPLYGGLTAEGRIARGIVEETRDEARFDKRHAHCDILVIGAGPAGLAAALEASRHGARVIVVESDWRVGGALHRDRESVDGMPGVEWASSAARTLNERGVRLLTLATAAVALDQCGMVVTQRIGAALAPSDRGGIAEQRLWQIRARAIVLATGALERPVVFQDNDRPGIMLAGAARTYLHRYALAPERGIVFTTTDDGYRTAIDWHDAGIAVAAIVDARDAAPDELPQRARNLGIRIVAGGVVEGTTGDADGRVTGAYIRDSLGVSEVGCDLLAVCGGWEPAINLHLQLKGATRYDARLGSAVADAPLPGWQLAGAANAAMSTRDALADGVRAARAALEQCGVRGDAGAAPVAGAVMEGEPSRLWRVPAPDGDETRSFVDLHRDATVAGIERAIGAGVRHVEHMKRYTLVGTGIEQGRSAKTNAGAITAHLTSRPVEDVGTSGSRPPTEPITFQLMAGRAKGAMYEPVRTTPMHDEHGALGAIFEPSGMWLRPMVYPREGESRQAAIRRECHAVRNAVGIADVSTLGKIDVQGPDATWFLEQLYANGIATIPVGKGRYSVMCHMDGSILDDGMVMRLDEQRYFVTTSTGHAHGVVEWFEEWLQTEWPSKRVWVTPVTERWATIAIAGPRSRELVGALAPSLDVSNASFPFLAVQGATVAGIESAQVARVSFSGELAFEVSVPWFDGASLWRAALRAGGPLGVVPYGVDALLALRVEKGYVVVGQDTEALTTPLDAGLGWLVSKRKDFVGRRSLDRPAMRRSDRLQLVGVLTDDDGDALVEGAGLVADPAAPPSPARIEGHVTSAAYSVTQGRWIGLALVKGGRARHGQKLHASMGDGVIAVTLVDPVHFDPGGTRRDG